MNLSQVSQVRFIKLGISGRWEKESIETDNPVIRLGYESDQHQECLKGNWEPVREYWSKGSTKNATTNHLRQIRDFYEADENTLWITFYNRKLYWCFAEKDVIELAEDKSRIRKVKGKWSDKDIKGNTLFIDNLDGRLTKTQGYRGTICGLDTEAEKYLLSRIKGEISPEVIATQEVLKNLKENLTFLTRKLNPKDFELLVDLIFSRLGWQRLSVLGKTEKNIDLDIYLPSLNKRAFVQIKSKATKSELKEYIEEYRNIGFYQEFYFVYHTCNDNLSEFEQNDVHLIFGEKLAEWIIQAGLVDWLLKKCA